MIAPVRASPLSYSTRHAPHPTPARLPPARPSRRRPDDGRLRGPRGRLGGGLRRQGAAPRLGGPGDGGQAASARGTGRPGRPPSPPGAVPPRPRPPAPLLPRHGPAAGRVAAPPAAPRLPPAD